MDSLFFYPTITEKMLEDAGCCGKEYDFSYLMEGDYYPLKAKGKNNLRLEDKLESWKIENDGIHIEREVNVAVPDIFKGENGVACRSAELGICVIWKNPYLKQMGYIMPIAIFDNNQGIGYQFIHDFPAGEIKGNLILETVIYIKKAANRIDIEEQHLMNETGVILGVIDSVTVRSDNEYMEFPIKEIHDKNQPLWWLELNQWEDPRQDPFNEDYICLYLNSAYKNCPKVGESIKNVELLVEIVSTAYFMIMKKIEEMNYLNDTVRDVNLEPGSIAKIMNYFCTGCNPAFRHDSIELMQKTIRQNIDFMLRGGEEDDSI